MLFMAGSGREQKDRFQVVIRSMLALRSDRRGIAWERLSG
jgi:hypothetical protein